MLIADIIRKKRDGAELTSEEISFFVAGLADGSVPAEQVSALAMAIFLNSMSAAEAGHLTLHMAASGTVLDWQQEDLDGPVVDKHSTGGVGDKVSFLLAPIAAACGCYIPMISGRGLGHTGGTTDKVEAIPGYQATPDLSLFKKVVRETGCAIIGQTEDLAPADRRLYAIRDVTGTIESVPLITASILSKKIAAGLDALVMDIKTGNGAFMKSVDDASGLAESIIGTAGSAGLKTHALITDMNECLGTTAGNALEIAESMQFLRDEIRDARLNDVVMALCAEMLMVSGVESDRDSAIKQSEQALSSGRAASKFDQMVIGLGGPPDFVEHYEQHLPIATVTQPVFADTDGVLCAMDTCVAGNAIIELGGGRKKLGDTLDLSVGFSDVASIGETIDSHRPLATIHANSEAAANKAAEMFRQACTIGDEVPPKRPTVYQTMAPE